MPEARVRDPALEFFYFGFYRALRRFRATVLAGWVAVAAGAAGWLLRWDEVWGGDLAWGALGALLIAAGIFLVQQGVSELTTYVRIPFPRPSGPDGGEGESVTRECAILLAEVDGGGWQEAARALAELRALGVRYGLPGPEGTPSPAGAGKPEDAKPRSHHDQQS